jgi:sugar transferase (PEP-CTERM/EpsH1 system associated)
MRILFVAAKFPHPPLRGFQVRAFHQLRLLSRRHRITLVCFSEAEGSTAGHATVSGWCEEIISVPHPVTAMIAGLGRAVVSDRPLQIALYENSRMRQLLFQILAEKRHDLVHVQLARMAWCLHGMISPPKVIDLVDALSLNFRRRSQRVFGPMRLATHFEAERLLRYEREICRNWDYATVVSLFDREAIGDYPNLKVNSSGVDFREFVCSGDERDPYTIVFSGNLGYFPNVDAICWFAREIFPRIRREEPHVKLFIVGARPARKVRALSSLDPQIVVTGFVDRPQAFLHRCALAVAPMRAGSGQLFKVLEAMACGAPLVATSLATAGTEAKSGTHFLLAQTPEAFAQQALRLIREPVLARRIAAEARQLVERSYGWEQSVSDLEKIYGLATERDARRESGSVERPSRPSLE